LLFDVRDYKVRVGGDKNEMWDIGENGKTTEKAKTIRFPMVITGWETTSNRKEGGNFNGKRPEEQGNHPKTRQREKGSTRGNKREKRRKGKLTNPGPGEVNV